MTHSFQYVASLPLTRRKLNARFVHKLKKLCCVFHLHVNEEFADDERGDYVWVLNKNAREDAKNCILSLCAAYGIGSDYISTYEDEMDGEGEYIEIYLSQKKL